jgi:alkylation response protein AidB-like acyl-CoA dehydrogenase
MDFRKSDIQTMLLDSAARLLGERLPADYVRALRESTDGLDRARWAQFAELGWLALPMPDAAGGFDGTLEDIALLNVELGKALAIEPYVSTAVLCGHIVAQAPQELAMPLLSTIAQGELVLALAHQEPGRDSLADDANMTVARRTSGGFVLFGAKLMAVDAPSSNKLVVSALIEGEDGTALFLVDREAAGVSLDAYALIDGTRAADITFHDVALGSEALLTGGNGGSAVLAAARDRASVALLAQAVGSMESCLRICGAYVKERRQFGTSIGSFQAIQHILADMFVASYQARSMLYYAIASGDADPATRAQSVSAAKIVIGEAGQLVSRNGIQVHGGYGLTDEYEISHHFRRLMAIEKLYGDLDRHTRRFGDASLTRSSAPP